MEMNTGTKRGRFASRGRDRYTFAPPAISPTQQPDLCSLELIAGAKQDQHVPDF